MSRNRSYIIVLVLLTLIAGLSGILGNIASSVLPETLQPYLWLAWPLFVVLMLITIGLVIWQVRLEQQPTTRSESGEPPEWLPQLADAITTAVQRTPSAGPLSALSSQPGLARDDAFDYDVFVSYSSKDRSWVHDELLPRLEAAGLSVCMDFRDFEPGAPSVTEMERAVQTSRKTLLVLTPDYLASAWTEFEALMLQTLDPASRERRLIPLLRAKCDLPLRIRYLTYVDFVEPEDGEIAWTRLLTAVKASLPQPPELLQQERKRVPHDNLPPRREFIGREAEKAQVHEALRSRSRLVCIDGIGGIGKTALALEVAYECLSTSRGDEPTDGIATFDGFIWATAKDRDLDLGDLLNAVARTLEYPGIVQMPAAEKKQGAVQKLLRTSPYLLIVDNFETITDNGVREFLLNLPEPSTALITTREKKLLDARMISLKRLLESEGLDLIRSEGKRLGLSSVEQVEDHVLLPLYDATGGAPLAIKWAIGQIKQRGQSLDTVLRSMYEAEADIFAHIFARSWDLLSEDARRVLTVMPIFATSALRAAIEALSGVHDSALNEALGQLVEMSLADATDELDLTRRRYSIHPLTRAFAMAKLQQEPEIQEAAEQRLVEFYQSFTEEKGGFWYRKEFAQLEPELPNILAVVQWCLKHQLPKMGSDILHNILGLILVQGYWNDVLDLYPAREFVTQQVEAMGYHISPLERGLLERACEVAVSAFGEQTRYSGDPYISHAIAVGMITLKALRQKHEQLNSKVVAAALTHDVAYVAGTDALADVGEKLGSEVLALIQEASDLEVGLKERHQDLDKAVVSSNKDAILIKLADRLHNMQTVRFLAQERWSQLADETEALYIPLAQEADQSRIAEELEHAVLKARL